MKGEVMRHFYIFLIIIVLAIPSNSLAIDESKLISSAEKVANNWKKLINSKMDWVINEENYYFVQRIKLINNYVDYDIKKTDSIISPYDLHISFQLLELMNYRKKELEKRNYNLGYKEKFIKRYPIELLDHFAFRSKEEALSYLNVEEFGSPLISHEYKKWDFSIIYRLKQNTWELDQISKWFNIFFIKRPQYGYPFYNFDQLKRVKIEY